VPVENRKGTLIDKLKKISQHRKNYISKMGRTDNFKISNAPIQQLVQQPLKYSSQLQYQEQKIQGLAQKAAQYYRSIHEKKLTERSVNTSSPGIVGFAPDKSTPPLSPSMYTVGNLSHNVSNSMTKSPGRTYNSSVDVTSRDMDSSKVLIKSLTKVKYSGRKSLERHGYH